MKIIPPFILDPQSTPGSEKRVFGILGNINIASSNFAIHSLNIAGDRKRTWYEMDFVVLSDRAVVVIEVKGGEVSKDSNGIWEVYDERSGKSYRRKESPLRQASLNARKFKNKVLGQFIRDTNSIPVIPCVILAGNHRTGWTSRGGPPDLPDDSTAYKEDVSDEGLKKFLNDVIDHFSQNSLKKISPETLGKIEEYLRSELDTGVANVTDLEKEVAALTEEQYQYADFIAPLDRVVIEGGAGTGKTFLALYIARAEASNPGTRVAYVTSALSSCEELRATNQNKERGNFSIINSTELEEYREKGIVFDVLVIDEGQQLCTVEHLDTLENLLEEGLEGGKWRWFGDPQNQVIEKKLFDNDAYELVRNFTGNNAVLRLNRNVRNTPQVVQFIGSVTTADLGSTQVKGHGPTVHILPEKKLVSRVKKWIKDPDQGKRVTDLSEIAILCRDKDDFPQAEQLIARAGLKTEIYGGIRKSKGTTILSTINGFRGLESRRVIIVGLDKEQDDHELRRLLYQSVSRSKAHVLIQDGGGLLGRLARIGGEDS